MNKPELDRLKAISSKDSYLYQLAKENSVDELKTAESEYFDDYASKDSENMQERADEFRKDDSEPEWNE